ncbi:LysR family transcriptional regulator [Pseudonocardia sp. EC080610-09]|uniref:LysR substrate-binding domain-containing protein n=1 Tax=unclassified Pseudonocardia TaxID=2619320 RepID=UPI0006CB4D75|nr:MULTISPECIES: LysR substrate-binding domain-containing protein [unclassified Pseudonocardia]ALE72369.1 LysR family transcriptional regulator [Pseudonocardia sp. EC080625-04]ALL75662.1 LysR family transcriptional regulator [Pseudonocardia sp. EC080610-09]ALL82690.1 LysR family transcriptional regulator [Pseudonocardia sp. EC080619-01]
MTDPGAPASFRLGYVPGVTPGKWARMWAERVPDVPLDLVTVGAAEAEDAVRSGAVDAGVVRLPIDRTGLHAIPLYTEATVVVVPKDHVVTAADEVTVEDLADELVLHPADGTLGWDGDGPGTAATVVPATTAEAVELVAAGVGVLVVPQSLARLHHRRDLTYRPLAGAPASSVVLTWPDAETSDLMEQFIGIVRGRTVNSSRTPRREDAPAPAPAKRPTARRRTARRGRPRR